MTKRRPRRPGFKPYEGLRILVVDDDPDVRLLVRRILAGEGAAVDEAGSVDQLYGILERPEKPDVVLLDLTMPGSSGWTALPQIHAADADIAVLILTGYDDAEFKRSARERGAVGYVTKPFQKDDLLYAVDIALGRTGGRDPWAASGGASLDRS